jgi:hypothetical protein
MKCVPLARSLSPLLLERKPLLTMLAAPGLDPPGYMKRILWTARAAEVVGSLLRR